MWLKYFIITVIFCGLMLLQSSFLPHFNVLGSTPNFVLIFYFLLIFFEKTNEFGVGFFGAVVAGLLIDIFSHCCLGASIIILIVLMLAVKKILKMLWERSDEYSIAYFSILFIFFLAFYRGFINFFTLNPVIYCLTTGWTIVISGIYNLLFALIGFYIFDKFNIMSKNDKQLRLFNGKI